MEKQIEEVKKYFIDRITACKFDEYSLKKNENWTHLDVIINGYSFSFGVEAKLSLYCFFAGFMKLEVPNDRLKNLITMINNEAEKIKSERIEKLKKELNQLQNS